MINIRRGRESFLCVKRKVKIDESNIWKGGKVKTNCISRKR